MRRISRSLALALLFLSPVVVGCGGSGDEPRVEEGVGGAPSDSLDTGPVRATDCSRSDGLEFYLIDDFELGAATGAFANNEVCDRCGGMEGEALSECQELCVESQYPTDFDKPLPAELIPGTRCGSRYALHVESQQFHEWGGIVGFPFAPAFDVREYEGVSFWGRVAWGSSSTLRASVLDPETDATFLDPEDGEPNCEDENTLDVFDQACDPYGGYAVMTGDWHFFKIPFSEMRQRGYGHVAPFLDLGAALQVSIEYGMGTWDFWIDDLAFYRKAEATQ